MRDFPARYAQNADLRMRSLVCAINPKRGFSHSPNFKTRLSYKTCAVFDRSGRNLAELYPVDLEGIRGRAFKDQGKILVTGRRRCRGW